MEIGSNLVLKDKKVRFNSKKPFEIITDFKKIEEKIDARFEHLKSCYTKAQLEEIYYSNPILLQRVVHVRTFIPLDKVPSML